MREALVPAYCTRGLVFSCPTLPLDWIIEHDFEQIGEIKLGHGF